MFVFSLFVPLILLIILLVSARLPQFIFYINDCRNHLAAGAGLQDLHVRNETKLTSILWEIKL